MQVLQKVGGEGLLALLNLLRFTFNPQSRVAPPALSAAPNDWILLPSTLQGYVGILPA